MFVGLFSLLKKLEEKDDFNGRDCVEVASKIFLIELELFIFSPPTETEFITP